MITRVLLILSISLSLGLFLSYSQALPTTEPLHRIENLRLAPDFSLMDIDEQVFNLKDLRGKVVIVNFWATWCPPCRFELPAMERAYGKLKDKDVVMLAINVGEDNDTIFNFTADYPVSFPLLMDTDSKVTQAYSVIGLPTTYIINPAGEIIYKVIGTREWDKSKVIEKIFALKK